MFSKSQNILKKILAAGVLSTSLCFANNQAFGQLFNNESVQVGIKGGLNLSTLYQADDDEIDDENTTAGFHAGVFVKTFLIDEVLFIQPELMYTTKGAEVDYNIPLITEGAVKFNLGYVELPVAIGVQLGDYVNIHAGPYISYLTNAEIKRKDGDGTVQDEVELDTDDFKKIDWGLLGGIGLDIQAFKLGVRYELGLQNIGEGQDEVAGRLTKDLRNSNFQIYAGFAF